MRHTAIVLLVVISACSTQQELATTTTGEVTTSTAVTTTSPSSTSTRPGSSTTTTPLPPLRALAYEEVVRLSFPIQLTARPGDRLSYIATKDGRVWAYDGSSLLEEPVLDISDQVRNSGEQGLLSIALHPEDPARMFAHYSANDGDTVVSEFTLTDELAADNGSQRVLLRLDQPASNHNGGMILFRSDDTLLVGLGDGGAADDRFNNGQNRDTLLGGLVAIGVDGDPKPTLYNYGLRNPWRFWIDADDIYIADVGQNSFEEVSVTSLEPDLNFGWPITEGKHCFRPSSGCDTAGITLPEVEVGHGDAGTCSITGGIVYRGQAIPEIAGLYFYSDYCGGYLRSFRYNEGAIGEETDWTDQVGIPGRVVGFGVDGQGEMYVATEERLFKVVPVRG